MSQEHNIKLVIRRSEEAILMHLFSLRDLGAITQTEVQDISGKLRKAIKERQDVNNETQD